MKDAIVLVTSDWHKGSVLAPWPENLLLPEGSPWVNNVVQEWIEENWQNTWEKWRKLAKNRRVIIVINGDSCEGVHHFPSQLVTLNMSYHRRAVVETARKVFHKKDVIIMVRGTRVHDGEEGAGAEAIAKELGCVSYANGCYSADVAKISVNGLYMFFSHPIASTGSVAGETTALMGQLAKAAKEAGLWGTKMPDIMGFAHRHRGSQVHIPGEGAGYDIFVTPSWVGMNEFSTACDPNAMPQIGGTAILVNGDGERQIINTVISLPKEERDEEIITL